MTTREPWIRVPQVHTGNGPAPESRGCPVYCLTCHQHRDHCDHGRCAPVCDRTHRPPGPVHICIVITHAAGRLIIRESRPQTTYTWPSGHIDKPPPIMWPLLVVDHCPHCSGIHLHTIHDGTGRWYRKAPCGRPYLITLRRRA